MAKQKITLDQLFMQQAVHPFLCTVEKEKDDNTVVKITPWRKGSGCLCNLSIKIKRSLIYEVISTGDFHYCCNKRLQVLEIKFKKDSSISLSDLFNQIYSRTDDHHSHSNQGLIPPFDYGERFASISQRTFPQYQNFGIQNLSPSDAKLLCGPCPPGYSCIGCGGQFFCAPNGSTCCNGYACPPGNFCLGCGGQFWCVPTGSTCCNGSPCPPGNSCLGCGGQFWCAQNGSTCCNGSPCPPENICLECGGQFWCVPKGSTCLKGKIAYPKLN